MIPVCYMHVVVPGNSEARVVIELIANAASPEEAAKTGRRFQRQQPALVRPDWSAAKLEVMLAALRAKVCNQATQLSNSVAMSNQMFCRAILGSYLADSDQVCS